MAFWSTTPSNRGVVQREAGRPGLHHEPDMNDHHAARAARFGQATDILDDILLAGVLRRARGREGAAFHHYVVLHVLNDQGAARRIDCEMAFGLARSGAAAAVALARSSARMNGSMRGPTFVFTA